MAPSTFVLDEDEEEHLQPAIDSPGPAPIASATPQPLHTVQLVQHTSPTLQPCDPVQLISAAVLQHGLRHKGHAFPGAPASLAEAVQQAQENQQHIAEAEQLLQRSCTLAQSQRRLEQQSVLAAISSSGHLLGCDGGRPVAALLIHRCLLHWRVLDAGPEASVLLEGLMGAMTAQGAEEDPQPGQDSKDGQGRQQQQQYALLGPGMQRLAYWLASSSTLLALLTKQAPRISAAAAAAAAASAGASLSSSDPAAHAPTALDRFSEMQRKLSSSIKAGWAQGLLAKIGKPKAPQPPALQEGGESMSEVMDSPEHSLRTGVHQAEEMGGSQTSASGHTIHTPGQHRGDAPANAGGETPSGARSSAGAHATLQGAGGAGTAAGAAAGGAAAVETFRQQLAGLTLRQYGLLRDAFKRQLAALLPACVQRNAGTLSPTSSDRLSSGGSWDAALLQPHSQASALGLGAASALRPWADLVLLLSAGLVMLQEQAVPRIIIKCLMKQLLAFIDVQMFNQLLLRPECCAASNAAFMAEGLGHLDAWLASQAGSRDTTYLVALQADLRHTRQAVQFLVYPNKGALSLQDITRACKSLSLQQLYRLCTTFWDDLPPPLQPPPCSPLKQQQHPGAGQQEVDGTGVAVEGQGDTTGGHEAEPSDAEQQQRQLRDGERGDAAVVPLEAHSDPLTSTTHDAAPHEPPVHTHKSAVPLDAQAVDRATSGAGDAAAAVPRRSTSVSSSGFLDHSLGAGLGGAMRAGVGAGGMVSGEVLEELKSHSQVSSNGGLIVTFLLDEDQQPLIGARHGSAQGPGGVAPCAVAYEVLYLIDDTLEPPGSIAAAKAAKAAEEGHECGGLYKRLKVPAHLLNDATPQEPFLFLQDHVDV